MNNETGASPGFDFRAVGSGALWGWVVMLIGALLQGLYGYRSPLSAGAEEMMAIIWQALGALISGFLAARRAQGTGWLHGALAGLSMLLGLTLVNGVVAGMPGLAVLAKAAGISAGAGTMGGIAGVNTRG